MTNKARTLTNALEMTPEKLAFIRSGSQGNAAPEEPPVHARVSVDTSQTPPLDPEPSIEKPDAERQAKRPSRRVAKERRVEQRTLVSGLRMSITTKLEPETVEALRRICLERRLEGVLPFTLQDIVEEAVSEWLASH